MSVLRGALARQPLVLHRSPLLAVVLLLIVSGSLALHSSSRADPSVSAVRLSAEKARAAGLLVELRPRAAGPGTLLLEVVAPGSPAAGAARDPRAAVPLAASSGGQMVAIADRQGMDPTSLVVAHADGSQVRVPMTGLLGAAFATDGSWLAVTDGHGRLWRVDSAWGAVELLSDGPLAGTLVMEPAGTILALAVSSVEAPFAAHLVRIDPASAAVTRLSVEELVYAMQPLADGSLAIAAHRPLGTVVQRLAGAGAELLADLGRGAVNVSVSSDGRVIAWERAGQIELIGPDGDPRRLGPGSVPRVSASGELLLVDRQGVSSLLTMDGVTVAESAHPALLVGCEGCAS